jgi:hypothetical protein
MCHSVYTSHQKVVLEIDFNGSLWVCAYALSVDLALTDSAGIYRNHHHPY